MDQGIFERFQEVAERFPHQTAIETPTGKWSYSQLLHATKKVMRQLEHLFPQSRIALWIRDPFWQAAAVLGALGQRLIYLFLDVNTPKDRLDDYLKDAAPSFVLCEKDLLQKEGESNHRPHQKGDIAALFYTSGSTGVPKQIFHTHASILREIQIHGAQFQIQHTDRFSSLYSLSTVGANRDFFGSLLHGATLCPFPFKQKGIEAFRQWVQKVEITLLHATPAIYRQLCLSTPNRQLESVRILFLAGETVSMADFEQFKVHFSKKALFYTGLGSSETCSLFAHWFVPRTFKGSHLPVGYPIDGICISLVDEEGTPVTLGEVGHITINSPLMAVGIPSPFQTGDLGMWDEEGRLSFIGRKDQLIKHHGERLSLIEMENRLRELREIKECAVIAVEGELFAYYSAKEVPLSNIRNHLARFFSLATLPQLILLDQLPLNNNGKIDRKQLGLLAKSRQRAPLKTTQEHFIANCYRTFFNYRGTLYQDSSFKELGGDSLAAVDFALFIEQQCSIRLTEEQFRHGATIGSLAHLLTQEHSPKPAAYWHHLLGGELSLDGSSLFIQQCSPSPTLPLLIWVQPSHDSFMHPLLASLAHHFPLLILFTTGDPLAFSQLQKIQGTVSSIIQKSSFSNILMAGFCLEGKIGLYWANALKDTGIEIAHFFFIDGFHSHWQVKWIQSFWYRLILRLKEPKKLPATVIRFFYRPSQKGSPPLKPFIPLPSYTGNGTLFLSQQQALLEKIPFIRRWNDFLPFWKQLTLRGNHFTLFTEHHNENFLYILKEILSHLEHTPLK